MTRTVTARVQKQREKLTNLFSNKCVVSKKDPKLVQDFKDEILKQIDEYCTKYDIYENDELITATVLDPRFKKLTFLSNDKTRKTWYTTTIKTIEGSIKQCF